MAKECKTDGGTEKRYGPWVYPKHVRKKDRHPDEGHCLTHGVERWKKRFIKKHPDVADLAQ